MNKTSDEFLVFSLGGEAFFIFLPLVREIVEARHITRVPETPHFLIGVLNLRGKIVPVVDLRRKFGLPDVKSTRDTSIIIVEAGQDEETELFGLLVDAISAVEKTSLLHVNDVPKFGIGINEQYIDGGFDVNKKYVVVLNINRLLSPEEFEICI